MASPDTLTIDVWQFVRIMVALEESARRGRRAGATYAAWRDIWRELDRRLTELGKSNAGAFSDLMMEQQVVVPISRPAVVREAVEAIEAVTRKMTLDLERGDGSAGHQADLRFERKELNALAHRISGRGGRRQSRSSPPVKDKPRPTNRQKNND